MHKGCRVNTNADEGLLYPITHVRTSRTLQVCRVTRTVIYWSFFNEDFNHGLFQSEFLLGDKEGENFHKSMWQVVQTLRTNVSLLQLQRFSPSFDG